jgi:preprotein translocase subunit YajC
VGSSQVGQFAPLLLILFAFVVLIVLPQRARAKAAREVRASLAPGARVMTSAGLHATVVELGDETVLLEIAPGVHARFAKAAVVRVLERSPTTPPPGAAGHT